ncbi:MAG: single-stranded DNA-binding protein [Anaerolineae bacterium]
MYQHTVIVGNVGRDPELRYTPSGDPVANFSVAVNRRWTNRDGQAQEKTTWFNISVFGRQAETVNQYVTKGRMVLVEGEVEARAYTAQDGTPRASLDLRARDVRFLGGRGEEQPMEGAAASTGSGGGYRRDQQSRGGARPSGKPGDLFPDEGDLGGGPTGEDEIPF